MRGREVLTTSCNMKYLPFLVALVGAPTVFTQDGVAPWLAAVTTGEQGVESAQAENPPCSVCGEGMQVGPDANVTMGFFCEVAEFFGVTGQLTEDQCQDLQEGNGMCDCERAMPQKCNVCGEGRVVLFPDNDFFGVTCGELQKLGLDKKINPVTCSGDDGFLFAVEELCNCTEVAGKKGSSSSGISMSGKKGHRM